MDTDFSFVCVANTVAGCLAGFFLSELCIMRTQKSLVATICLALILTVGLTLGWGVLVAWITTLVAQTTASEFAYEVLTFRNDGLPLIVCWKDPNRK
jgi:hypothetical protein